MSYQRLARLACWIGSSSLVLSTLAVTNPGGYGPAAAREELKNLKAADGLEVSLFASEPMVRNPANMDVDARGRVWVTEGANYRVWQKWGKLRPEGDRIVILEDTDGDGVADKETTFYQGNDINTALGICVLGNKVVVSCSPNVFVFTDEDGDGKADKKEVLFTGIQGVDNDHGVHAFVFGPDGKLYFNMGNASHEVHRPDGSLVKDKEGNPVIALGKPFRQGMVFRCNLDGSDFEVLGYNFRNPYEVAVDSFGTVWQSDNDDDGNQGVRINYIMPYGNYGYTDDMTGASWGAAWKAARDKGAPETQKVFYEWHQFDPGVVPDLLHTGAGSPTGMCVYEGKLLPAVYQNQLIHADAGPRVVRAYSVHPDGAGYQAKVIDILTSSDNWFRPSDVCVGPDGSLYVADWNDAGVGGHYMADQNLETMTGRVYRIAPKGRKAVVPELDLSSPSGCAQALQSPNQATRYLAWTKLHDMKRAAESDLLRLWHGKNSRQRARALHLLARLPEVGGDYLKAALQDPDPDLRAAGLRIASAEQMDVLTQVGTLVNDPAPEVRRECAIALRHNASAEAPKLWAALARQHDGKDRWYLEALGIGADQQWDRFLDAWLDAVGNDWNTPAGRDIVWRSRAKKTPGLLVKIINDPATPAAEREHYMRAFDFVQGPEKDAALIELLTGAAGGK
jgi:putative membrane-bound dehydrogenase-like protein